MMGYWYDGSGTWTMWLFGGLMMVGALVLIGLVVWAIVTAIAPARPGPGAADPCTTDGRSRTRQVLDERYARGDITTDEYTERLHTLGL